MGPARLDYTGKGTGGRATSPWRWVVKARGKPFRRLEEGDRAGFRCIRRRAGALIESAKHPHPVTRQSARLGDRNMPTASRYTCTVMAGRASLRRNETVTGRHHSSRDGHGRCAHSILSSHGETNVTANHPLDIAAVCLGSEQMKPIEDQARSRGIGAFLKNAVINQYVNSRFLAAKQRRTHRLAATSVYQIRLLAG